MMTAKQEYKLAYQTLRSSKSPRVLKRVIVENCVKLGGNRAVWQAALESIETRYQRLYQSEITQKRITRQRNLKYEKRNEYGMYEKVA